MTTLTFEGDARTIGIEEGRAYRDCLERIIWGGAIPGILSEGEKVDPGLFGRALASALPNEWGRIEAICGGAVLNPPDLLSIYARELGVTFRLSPPTTALIAALSHDRYEGGIPAVGVNIDAPIFLSPFITTRKFYPRAGFSRIEVSLISMAGTLSGLNDQGLAAALSLKPYEGGKGGFLPLSLIVREVLRKCRDAKAALRLIGSFVPGASGTIVLADSYSIMIVEMTPTSLEAREFKSGSLVHTAHFLLPTMMPLDLPHRTTYPQSSPSELIGKRLYEQSEKRLDRAFELIEGRKQWDAGGLGEVLSDCDSEVCLSSGFYKTCVSLVLLPAQKTVFVSAQKKGKFTRIFL
jgi:hypothetical protein